MKNAIRKLYARKAIPGDQLNVHGPQCPFKRTLLVITAKNIYEIKNNNTYELYIL